MTNLIKIPMRYIDIQKEKKKPTAFIMHKRTHLLKGRLEKGEPKIPSYHYGRYGETRVIRMKEDYRGFRKGQVIARTKKEYPNQPNSVLERGKTGKIKTIAIVKEHDRRSRRGRNYFVRRHNRKLY